MSYRRPPAQHMASTTSTATTSTLTSTTDESFRRSGTDAGALGGGAGHPFGSSTDIPRDPASVTTMTDDETEGSPLTPHDARGQSLVMVPQATNHAKFHSQLFATLKRQLIQKRRGWIVTLLEILLPAIFTLALVLVANINPYTYYDPKIYANDSAPLALTSVRAMLCYNGPTAPELTTMILPCAYVNDTFTCAPKGELPVENLCVVGGQDSVMKLGGILSSFSDEIEIPNLDDMILLKWMVKAVIPPSDVFWDVGTTFSSLQNAGEIFMIPNSLEAQAMRNVFHNRYQLFKYVWGGFFDSRDDALPYVRDVKNEGKTWALIEVREVSQRNLDFVIMTNRSGVPWMNLGPRETYPMGLGTKAYAMFFGNGFLSMQKAVSDYYLTDVLGVTAQDISPNSSPTHISMQPMGLLDHKYSSYLVLSLLIGPFVLVLAFLFPISQLAKRLVEEKELRLREGTMIMGLTKTAFFSSWLIIYYVQMIIASLIVTMVQKLAVTTETNFGIIFFTYLIFVIATINFAAMLSTFFSRAQTAALVVPLIYFVVAVPAFAMPDGTAPAAFHALSIFCPTPLAVALRLQFGYEVNRGIGWQDFTNDQDIPYNYLAAVLWMVGDAIAYLILLLYFDAVLPKEWGTTRHPLFFLKSKRSGGIWGCCGKSQRSDLSDSDDNEMGSMDYDNPSRFMTKTPSHYAVQDYPMPNLDSTVSIQKLRKEFPAHGKTAKPVAIDDMYLRLFPDGITVLLGHNGAGKTTVMNMMTGMMPPTDGDVNIYGKSIRHDMQEIRRDIGFCPQHNILWDDLTCMEHLQYFARLKGMSGDDVDTEAEEMLSRVDLLEKRDVLSTNLSGGQKRKLSVAIAFMGRARLVLLDEPTAGMDVAARRHTWDVLKDMSKGRTILLTTHYMDEADLLGSRIAIMSKGSLHSYGTPMYLKNNLGTGYVMKVACEHAIQDPLPMLREIQKLVPEATLVECKGQEAAFSLPNEATKLFPDVIRHMESPAIARKFEINSVSMSVATLEDIFLAIANEVPEGAEEDFEQNETCEREEAFHALEACYVDLQRQTMRFHERSASGNQLSGTQSQVHLSRYDIAKRQMIGMLTKRLNHSKRDYFALGIQIAAPIVCILIAMLLSLINLPGTPLHYMENSQYGSRRQMLSTNNCEDLDPYWSLSGFSVLDQQNIDGTVPFAQHLLDTYDMHGRIERMISYDCYNKYNTTVFFVNATSLQSGPQAMNEFYQARARQALSDGGLRMRVASFPLPFSDREESQVTGIKALLSSLFVLIPFTFIPSVFTAYIVRERECKSKHLQFVSGANFVVYWLSNFIFDIISYLITTLIAFVIFFAFEREEFVGSAVKFFATLCLFIFYGLSAIGMAYLVSNFFHHHSTAQTVTLLVCFLSGFILVVVIFFLEYISDSTEKVADVLVFFFRLIPPFCLGDGLKNLALSNSMDRYNTKQSPFKLDIIGWDLIYMGVEALIFFTAAIVLDHPKRNEKQQSMGKYSEAPDIHNEEVDVLRERVEVESGERDDDVLQVQKLRKVYSLGNDKAKVAVQNLTFGVKQGEVFGFLGTNGAGKTTTMSMLTTEILPTCGEAYIGGYDVVADASKTRKLIGYCPQFDATMDLLTPDEHLRMFAALRSIPYASVDKVVDALIKTCALTNYRNVPSGKLSGGNKRKLSVAMALIGGPSIVLLDEPSAGMDPHARRQLWDVISFVAKHSSVLLTTHHLEEVDVLAHRVGIMDGGQLKCLGSLEHLKRKFGNGYELTVQVDSLEGAEAAVSFLFETYPEAILVEARQQRMIFTLPYDSTNLADLFQAIQVASEDPATGIIDYTVRQTSLEQVFLRISAMKEAEDEADAGNYHTDEETDSDFDQDQMPSVIAPSDFGGPNSGFALPADPNDPVWEEDPQLLRNDASARSKLAASAMYVGSVFDRTAMLSHSTAMRQSQHKSLSAALHASLHFNDKNKSRTNARKVGQSVSGNNGNSFASMS